MNALMALREALREELMTYYMEMVKFYYPETKENLNESKVNLNFGGPPPIYFSPRYITSNPGRKNG